MKYLKYLLFVIILLPLLIGVTTAQAYEITTDLGDGVTAVETVTTEASTAGCKSQSHRINYYKNGILVAYSKVTGTNACWGVCMTLGNSSRSHWATIGWAVSWGGSVLGGAKCTSTPIIRGTYDNIYGPGVKYQNYQSLNMWIDEPLDMNWYWWSVRK